jgi:outer membrane lipoprotein SlyB
MNALKIGFIAAMLGAGALLSGCVSSNDSGTYSRSQVGQVNQVDTGMIVSVRQVKIEGTRSGVGTGAGAIAGAAGGSQIGGGTASNVAGGVAGAVIGGLIGAAIEEGATRSTGFEYTIRLDDGRTITIVQGKDVVIAPGTRVQVLYGERARVIPIAG